MIIAGTGYRPQKLGGFSLPNATYNKVCQETAKLLSELEPDQVISGMCIGYDMWLASIAFKLKIPFIAAIPFEGQEKSWPEENQKTYRLLRRLAFKEVIVSEGGYAASKMQLRNQWMVDHCDNVIAVIKPNEISGGTYNCVEYAKSVKRPIYYIDPTLDNSK